MKSLNLEKDKKNKKVRNLFRLEKGIDNTTIKDIKNLFSI